MEVPDLDASQVLGIGPDALEELRRLVEAVCKELEETPSTPETLKRAAMLVQHLQLLSAEQTDDTMADNLDALRQELEGRIEDALEAHEERVLDAGLLSQNDQRDLRILLRRGTGKGSSLWLTLLRYFYSAVGRWIRRR